jgi:tyrosyl-tRNA synthetase
MSKSKGNTIGLTDPPEEQFGRTMRISDDLVPDWYRLVMEAEPPGPDADPMEAKLELARFVVRRSHGEAAARAAEAHFTRVVREGRAPDDVPEVVVAGGASVYLPAVLVEHLGVPSTSEARRLIAQGGLRLDGETVEDIELPPDRLDGALLQAGKRRFARLRVAAP